MNGPEATIKSEFFDLEAEQAVLGSLVYRNDLFGDVKEILNSLDFGAKSHQLIFQAMDELGKKGQPIDEILIGDQLIKMEKLEQAGGRPYLAELIDFVPSSGNVLHYAQIVKDYAEKRGLYSLLHGGLTSLNSGGVTKEVLAEILRHSENISQSQGFNPVLLKDCAEPFFEKLKNISIDGQPLGLLTGFNELDQILSSLEAGDFCVIGGRPSTGKTDFGLNLSLNFTAAFGAGLFISLEMTKEKLYERVISKETEINNEKLKSGQILANEWDVITKGMGSLDKLPLYLMDQNLPLDQLIFGVKSLHRKDPLSFVLLDYLQMVETSQGNNRTDEIEIISKTLKRLAKDLGIPVIALAGLNRILEGRPDKRPIMSDLKGSSAIEHDADFVLFLYREEIYNSNPREKGVAEIIVRKNRNGPIGTIKLKFRGAVSTFKDENIKVR